MTGGDKRWKQEWRFIALGEFVLLTPCANIPTYKNGAKLFTALQILGRHFIQGYLDKAKVP